MFRELNENESRGLEELMCKRVEETREVEELRSIVVEE